MNKVISIALSIMMFFNMSVWDLYEIMWSNASDDVRQTFPIAIQAHACGIDETEYEFMARVIEMESDRSDSLDGKILIAAVILNRANPENGEFPDTITGVLTQSGQFTTVSGGWCSHQYTTTSKWAIVEAQRQIATGDIPTDLLYFNCIGYNYGTPYGYVDGNYFMEG